MITYFKALLVLTIAIMGSASVFASAANFAIRPSAGSQVNVASGHTIDVEIYGTFDKRLTSASYKISVNGQYSLTNMIVNRSVNQDLAYVASDPAAPDPFNPSFGLPYALSTSMAIHPVTEVLLGLKSAWKPGAEADGILPPVEPNTYVLLETLTIRSVGDGLLMISISEPSASTTEIDPNGSLFDTVGITSGQHVAIFIVAMDADFDNDGDVDMVDYAKLQICLGNDIVANPDCAVADFDNDGIISSADTNLFMSCSSGPNIQARDRCRGEYSFVTVPLIILR